MKVIFLDIDGVLNCQRTYNPRHFPYVVDKKLLARLAVLINRTGAKVVLTSTWRLDPIGLLAAKYWGIPFIDCTPDMPKRSRRDEVLAWVNQKPRVTRFAILDDEDDELDNLPLFQPSSATGLTTKITRGIEAYLTGTTNETMRASALVRLGQNINSLFGRDKS